MLKKDSFRLLLSCLIVVAFCGLSGGANETIVELNLKGDTTIQCDESFSSLPINWTKDGAPLNLADQTKYFDNKTSIVIHMSKDSDGGVYVCLIDGGLGGNRTIIAMSRARVEKLPESINLAEGETLNLTCTVFGYPLPDVTWLKDDAPVKELNNPRIQTVPNGANATDATLLIEKLTYDDRAHYTCVARNRLSGESSANDTVLVRVKDKLAALWPFLGIVAEVVILCTIIFIYEKRRAKQEYDESDTDQNNESKPVADQKDKEVRQRK